MLRKLKLLAVVVFVFSCTKTEIKHKDIEKLIEYPITEVQKINISDIQKLGNEMFTKKDEEIIDDQKILYNKDLRGFKINEMLEIKLLGNNKYRIRNFLPHTFKNLELIISNDSFSSPIPIASFDEFPALYEYEGVLPFSEKETFFIDKKGEKVSVENFQNIPISDLNLYFETNDPMFAKIKSIRLETFYTFADYKQPGKWDKVTVDDAKNYLPLVLNMAYVFSSDAFEKAILEAPYDFTDNKKVLDRKQVIKSLRTPPRQILGIIIEPGTGGLGGGSTFGVRREYINNPKNAFYKEINLNDRWGSGLVTNVWIHEFGHVAGYGHDGNMTYFAGKGADAQGLVPITMALYQKMLLAKELPFNEYPY
ncbi:hypothetical protein [Capnocytophaga canimorsus]|uniref:hypothetical protein n=1 Tax=Capnocytophaga canimorsus TaxID=28188 RepID=UPI000D6DE7BF|nr:hypothetical protein [Capnocytophaga canimorsus]AWL79431.1 hypothetical protein DKB58_11040 [Capnocytophaga canimorsus]AYW36008.1 hypothetical protein D8L92_00770 [Capnocytophaga canimorsus]MDT9500583.1 hypothetical protein [Capnocytophaga canimorsus]